MRKLVLSAAALLAMGLGSLGTIGAAQAGPFFDPSSCHAPATTAGNSAEACQKDGAYQWYGIFQNGSKGTAVVKQGKGYFNKATIVQPHGSKHQHATILQLFGFGNDAYITQKGDHWNKATIKQIGGFLNDATVDQHSHADNDSATVTQVGGAFNDANVDQYGDHGSASVKQINGVDNSAQVTQNGDYNKASVTQDGGYDNHAYVQQNSDGGSAAVVSQQGGSHNGGVIIQN